ncbi:MAG: hypothetical protein Q9220_007274 [cf. Caloplaca sp. 1 TL-2023]
MVETQFDPTYPGYTVDKGPFAQYLDTNGGDAAIMQTINGNTGIQATWDPDLTVDALEDYSSREHHQHRSFQSQTWLGNGQTFPSRITRYPGETYTVDGIATWTPGTIPQGSLMRSTWTVRMPRQQGMPNIFSTNDVGYGLGGRTPFGPLIPEAGSYQSRMSVNFEALAYLDQLVPNWSAPDSLDSTLQPIAEEPLGSPLGTTKDHSVQYLNNLPRRETMGATELVSTVEGSAMREFDVKTMTLRSKRVKRKYSPAEKERVKNVRRVGACRECREKKRKCEHALSPTSPLHTPESEDSEPKTPDSDLVPGTPNPFHDAQDPSYDFEDQMDSIDFDAM